MKNSSKILITFVMLIILTTAASFTYVRSIVEIEPDAFLNGPVTKNIFTEGFTSIDVKRGNWFLEMHQSDSCFVQIKTGDNMANKYLKIDVVDSTLIIDIDSTMISNEFRYLNATIEIASLKRLDVDNNSFYKLVDFDKTNLDLNLKNGSIFLDKCRIENLFIDASGNSTVTVKASTIKNLNYSIRDSAVVLAQGVENINCLDIEDLAVFFNYLDHDQFVIKTSEERKRLTNQMTSYVSNLKWLMPLDTVLQIMEKDSLNFRLKDEERTFVFESLSETTIVIFYNISGKNPDVENIQLIFSRGLLTDITVKYFSFGDLKSIQDKLKKTFNSQYGAKYKWEQPSYFGVSWDDINTEYWRAPEQNIRDKYTSIQLHYNDFGWLSIYYSSPINSFWSRSMNRMSYEIQKILYGLRSFPNIVESFTRYFNTPARRPH